MSKHHNARKRAPRRPPRRSRGSSSEDARIFLSIVTENAELREKIEAERAQSDRFVSTLSHDVRTPLTVIKASAEMLEFGPDKPERRREFAQKIVTNVMRADRMLRDLLDVNRIRAGSRLPLDPERRDLRAITLELIQELSLVHGKKFVIQEGGPVVGYWDPEKMRRAIENLLVNAVKYGDPEAPVSIRAERDGNFARLAVHNEGKPVDPGSRTALFRLFSPHVAKPSAEIGSSWGIGLTLVRGITEAHGGRVMFVSGERKGTTFFLLVPMDARPFAARMG